MSLEVPPLRALAHPLRLQILSLLTGADMCAAEIARELDLTQANASYHLRHLRSAGLIVDAGSERIRGGVAKRYRYDPDTPVESGVDPSAEPLFAQALAAELVRRSGHRKRGARGPSADADLWLSPEDWHDIRDRVADAMHDLHKRAHRPRAEGTVRVSVTVALFELDD